jgi:hypothetical protein
VSTNLDRLISRTEERLALWKSRTSPTAKVMVEVLTEGLADLLALRAEWAAEAAPEVPPIE